jgi:hypothetical protein
MESVVTQGKWNRKDLSRSLRLSYRFKFNDAIFIGGFLAIGWALHQILLFGILAIILNISINTWLGSILAWTLAKKVREHKVTTVSDEGISTVGESFSAQTPWSAFAKSKESTDFYILQKYQRGLFDTFFRKKAFTSRSDEARFRSFLRLHTDASLLADPILDRLSSGE